MTRLSSVGILVLVLSLGACTSEKPAPQVTATPIASATSNAPAAVKYRYQPSTVDLCKTDLTPLAELKLAPKKTDSTLPLAGPGEACLFEMTTPSGHIASLRVEAVALTSSEDAQRLYKTQHDTTRMKPDGGISGLGDEAEGFTLETEPGFKYSEYRVHARQDNLVLEVWVAVGGNAFTPKQILAAIAQAVTRTTLATVSAAWPNRM